MDGVNKDIVNSATMRLIILPSNANMQSATDPHAALLLNQMLKAIQRTIESQYQSATSARLNKRRNQLLVDKCLSVNSSAREHQFRHRNENIVSQQPTNKMKQRSRR